MWRHNLFCIIPFIKMKRKYKRQDWKKKYDKKKNITLDLWEVVYYAAIGKKLKEKATWGRIL
jgi:hypothetical protein